MDTTPILDAFSSLPKALSGLQGMIEVINVQHADTTINITT
jgi:hypothetical protein